jgi:hypothetical protein
MDAKNLKSLISALSITSLVLVLALFMVYVQKTKEGAGEFATELTPGSQLAEEIPEVFVQTIPGGTGNECAVSFEITSEVVPVECGVTCELDADCAGELVCITADDGNGYCAMDIDEVIDACGDNPTYSNCCELPEEEVLVCGEFGCSDDNDCEGEAICITADNGAKYCSMPAYQDACGDNPTANNCCEEQPPEQPELPRAGSVPPTVLFVLGGVVLVGLGLLF